MTTQTVLDLQKFCLDKIPGFEYFRPGTTLADVLESFHGTVRSINPCPDILQFMYIVRGVCMGNIIEDKARKGANYEMDDAKEYLTYLENVKKLEAEKNDEPVEDEHIFYEGDFNPNFDSEKLATTYHGGYLLFKILKKNGKCE